MTGVIHSSAVAEVMKDITEFLADSQTAVARLGPMYSWIVAREIGKRQEIGANDNKTGADIIIPLNTCALGLLPNKQTIDFCGTDQVFVSIPAVWPWPGLHAHIAFTESVGTVDKTWYFADRNKFFKKKITVIAVKNSDSGSNKGYPLFGDWIGITWPSMQTVASACYYNKSGPGNVLYTNPSSGDVHETHVRDSFYESRDHGGKWQAHLVPVNQFAIMH